MLKVNRRLDPIGRNHRKLMVLDDQVKAIVSSGYSHIPIMPNHAKHGFKGVVSKPCRIQDLIKVLSSLLG